jgi:hypothetical protein
MADPKAETPIDSEFQKAWARKEAKGYRYGHDALEQVRLGWDMAKGDNGGEGRDAPALRISLNCTAVPEDCFQVEHVIGKEQVAVRVVQDEPGEEIYLSREDTVRLRDFLMAALGESAPKAPPSLPIDLRDWDVYVDTLPPSPEAVALVGVTATTWQDQPVCIFAKPKVSGTRRKGERR